MADYRQSYGLRRAPTVGAVAPKVGGGPQPSSLDILVISGRTLGTGALSASSAFKTNQGWLKPKDDYWGSVETDEAGKTQRRTRRLYQRFHTGVNIGGRVRFLTLTSSDEAVAAKRDIHNSWRILLKRLRRRLGRFEYIGVREVAEDGRQHLHLVFRGSYIEQVLISHLWEEIHLSPMVYIEAVNMKGIHRMGHYLAKYIAKSVFNRYWASYGWVFKGWVGWSKRVKRTTGAYPSRELIGALARMGEVSRVVADSLLMNVWRLSRGPELSVILSAGVLACDSEYEAY